MRSSRVKANSSRSSMWSYVLLMPIELSGACIVPFLSFVDLVHADSAIQSKVGRDSLALMIRRTAPILLPPLLSNRPRTWQWFWDRKIVIADVRMPRGPGNIDRGFTLLLQNLKYLTVGLHIKMCYFTACESQFAPIITNESLAAKVLTLESDLLGNFTMYRDLCGALTQLRKFTCMWGDGVASVVPSVIIRNTKLENICTGWQGPLDHSLFSALAQRARTLTCLDLTAITFSNEDLCTLAHCTSLRELKLHSCEQEVPQELLADGVTALALGCRHLETITLYGPQFSGAVHILALHCHAVHKLVFECAAALTSTVLRNLRVNCPHLHTILGADWDDVSSADVQANAAVFERLVSLTLYHQPTDAWENASLADAAALLTIMVGLELYGAPLTATQLHGLAQGCNHLQFLMLGDVDTSDGNASNALVDLVRANRELTRLEICSPAWIVDDALLVALSESCPSLETFTGETVLDGLHDDALIALARGCAQLKKLDRLQGAGVTDRAVHALTDHCRKLQNLDLQACPNITNFAVAYLLQHRPNIHHVQVSPRNSAALLQVCTEAGLNVECREQEHYLSVSHAPKYSSREAALMEWNRMDNW